MAQILFKGYSALPQMRERREAARIQVNLSVRYSSKALSFDARASNLSRRGLFLCSDVLDGVGERAVLTLNLPGSSPLEVSGQVVRVVLGRSRSGMGIQFSPLRPGARRTLANFMIRRRYSAL